MQKILIPDHFRDTNKTPLPPSTVRYLDQISVDLASTDCYSGNHNHYLYSGASALNSILCSIHLANNPTPKTILDFGSGAGRVTRWLRAAFPNGELHASDLRTEDLAFLAANLNCKVSQSSVDLAALNFDTKFDVIWAGSVLTHLSKEDCILLLRQFLNWLNPGGIAIASYHGRHSLSMPTSYIEPIERWHEICQEYQQTGFGYRDYTHSPGYGISLANAQSMAALVMNEGLGKIVCITERAYDEHQDVICIQNKDVNHHRTDLYHAA